MPGETGWEPVGYEILGGINQDDAEDHLQENEVVDAGNFLFERGHSFTRPGVQAAASSGFTGAVNFCKSFRLNGSPVTLVFTNDNKIWKLSIGLAATQITGFTIADSDIVNLNAAAVNGTIFVADQTLGASGAMANWDPTGITASAVTISNWFPKYVTGYFSRAVIAMNSNVANATGYQSVGWSISGDGTNFSSVGSGFAQLADSPDDITGLGTIRNALVIPRRTGIHLGFPTGTSLPTFRFEAFRREGIGFGYPDSNTFGQGKLWGVGQDDVYTFDLNEFKPIGRKIRDELLQYLDNGVNYQGFLQFASKVPSKRKMRLRYHLIPQSSTTIYPHFVYDALEDKWSKHWYSFPVRGGFNWVAANGLETVLLFDNSIPANFYQWDPTLGCESPAFLLGKVQPLFDQESDYRINRALLRTKNFGAQDVKVSVSMTMDNYRQVASQTKVVGTDPSDETWQRTLFDMDIAGQDAQVRIDVAPGQMFATNYCSLQVSKSGEFRGPQPTTNYITGSGSTNS